MKKNHILKVILLFLIVFSSIILKSNLTYAIQGVETNSPSIIMIDSKTDKILYEKNANTRMYPASITKILTAIIIIENCNLSDTTTASYNSVMSLPTGYSSKKINVGEEITIENLLYLLLIDSSNEAGIILAEHASESTEGFATIMNTKANEIGARNSNFTNPSGLHDEKHYTTASDFALIAKYCMQNETFKKIVSTDKYVLNRKNGDVESKRTLSNTNELIMKSTSKSATNYFYQYATGIKTGFTTPAKNTLVASSSKDDMEFIIIILGADKLQNGISYRYSDSIALFEKAYATYQNVTVKKQNDLISTINIKNASSKTKKLDLLSSLDIIALSNKQQMYVTPEPSISLKEDIKAPIKKGDIIGTATYTIDGTEYKTNLIANNDVVKNKVFQTILIVVLVLITIFILLKLVKSSKRQKKNRKKSKKSKAINYKNYKL